VASRETIRSDELDLRKYGTWGWFIAGFVALISLPIVGVIVRYKLCDKHKRHSTIMYLFKNGTLEIADVASYINDIKWFMLAVTLLAAYFGAKAGRLAARTPGLALGSALKNGPIIALPVTLLAGVPLIALIFKTQEAGVLIIAVVVMVVIFGALYALIIPTVITLATYIAITILVQRDVRRLLSSSSRHD